MNDFLKTKLALILISAVCIFFAHFVYALVTGKSLAEEEERDL